MKKRFWPFFVFLTVLAVVGVLLLRFAPLGTPAGHEISITAGETLVTAADKLALKTEIDGRMAGKTSADEGVRLTKVEQLLLEYGCTGNMHLLPNLMGEGVYLLEKPMAHHVGGVESAKRGEANVTVFSPSVFYDGYTQEWIVLCGGRWNGDRDVRFAGDVGGRNRFGVTCAGDPETYNSHVPYAVAGLWAADGTDDDLRSYTNYRAGGNGAGSFDFELQDYVVITGIYDRHYVGEQWAGFCRFAPGYETYEAELSAFYIFD